MRKKKNLTLLATKGSSGVGVVKKSRNKTGEKGGRIASTRKRGDKFGSDNPLLGEGKREDRCSKGAVP